MISESVTPIQDRNIKKHTTYITVTFFVATYLISAYQLSLLLKSHLLKCYLSVKFSEDLLVRKIVFLFNQCQVSQLLIGILFSKFSNRSSLGHVHSQYCDYLKKGLTCRIQIHPKPKSRNHSEREKKRN